MTANLSIMDDKSKFMTHIFKPNDVYRCLLSHHPLLRMSIQLEGAGCAFSKRPHFEVWYLSQCGIISQSQSSDYTVLPVLRPPIGTCEYGLILQVVLK